MTFSQHPKLYNLQSICDFSNDDNTSEKCSLHVIFTGAGIAQLVSAWSSKLEVPGSILGDSNVCFNFLLICVALALNTRKTEH